MIFLGILIFLQLTLMILTYVLAYQAHEDKWGIVFAMSLVPIVGPLLCIYIYLTQSSDN